jgi:DNA-binding transcriptional regulator YhcF (GntR family)
MIATNIAIYTRLNTLLFDLLFVFASVIKLPLLCKTDSFVLQIVNQIILSVDNYYSTDYRICQPDLCFKVTITIRFDVTIDFTTNLSYNNYQTKQTKGALYMQISSRFTLAIHIIACIETFKNEYKVTSDFLAGSTNVNPVIVRKILGQLKSAGIVEVARGSGGAVLSNRLTKLHFSISTRRLNALATASFFIFTKIQIPNVLSAETFTPFLTTGLTRFSRQWKTN